jgi:hypothetical protein
MSDSFCSEIKGVDQTTSNSLIGSIYDFLFKAEYSLWQELFWGSLLIPLMIKIYQYIFDWLDETNPRNKLLKGYISTNKNILIFLSQLSPSINGNKNPKAEFISFYPVPKANNINEVEKKIYGNIDPLWSESDGKCANYVINLLGKTRSKNKYKIAHLINDWDNIYSPIITIGFNPKTNKLLSTCYPIYFSLEGEWLEILNLEGHKFILKAIEKDWGVIQRTTNIDSKQPVYILAGGGTAGTEVAGYLFNKYSIELGKLYGNKNFCLSFETDRKNSNTHYILKSLYPYPDLYNQVRYFYTFLQWYRKNIFPEK